jgi:hypothetical protein
MGNKWDHLFQFDGQNDKSTIEQQKQTNYNAYCKSHIQYYVSHNNEKSKSSLINIPITHYVKDYNIP